MVAPATVLAHVLSLLEFVKEPVQASVLISGLVIPWAFSHSILQQLLFGIGCGFAADAH